MNDVIDPKGYLDELFKGQAAILQDAGYHDGRELQMTLETGSLESRALCGLHVRSEEATFRMVWV